MKISSPDLSKTIAIIAGSGTFPLSIAQNAHKQGAHIAIVAFNGYTSKKIEEFCQSCIWINVGELTKMLSFLKKEKAAYAIFAGTISHEEALKPLDKIRALADIKTLKFVMSLKNKTTKSILNALIDMFKEEGITTLPSYSFLEHDLVPEKTLTKRQAGSHELSQVRQGFIIAKKLSSLDIGLTVCMSGGAAIAVEAMEGTDECIKRAGNIFNKFFKKKDLKPGEGITIVKVARPDQDARYDLPIIGPSTIQSMLESQATCLACEAKWTLMMEHQDMINLANSGKITIVGVSGDKV
ncbi:LpxI family protein [Elusimicrobiota bacterium]